MYGAKMNKIFDKIGICVSSVCLVHCLLMPILLLSFPALSAQFDHTEHDVHLYFGILVFLSAAFAMFPHCKKSGRKDILLIASMGVFFVIAGFTIGHEVSEIVEHILTIIGSILLVTAHYKNIKIKHSKCEDKKAPCSSHH